MYVFAVFHLRTGVHVCVCVCVYAQKCLIWMGIGVGDVGKKLCEYIVRESESFVVRFKFLQQSHENTAKSENKYSLLRKFSSHFNVGCDVKIPAMYQQ